MTIHLYSHCTPSCCGQGNLTSTFTTFYIFQVSAISFLSHYVGQSDGMRSLFFLLYRVRTVELKIFLPSIGLRQILFYLQVINTGECISGGSLHDRCPISCTSPQPQYRSSEFVLPHFTMFLLVPPLF
jgi:hypothetical protein